MSEIELKACPFCGGTAFMAQEGTHATCLTPGCCVGPVSGVDSWNTRAPQWQPIETVPHGKWVYVASVGASCGGVAMLADYWINPDMRPDQHAERATHWQPLPAPPEVVG